MTTITLETQTTPTDIQEFWTEYIAFTPVVIDENQRPAVIWRTICETCGDTIRLTLRERPTDFIQSPAAGSIIETNRFDCACSSL